MAQWLLSVASLAQLQIAASISSRFITKDPLSNPLIKSIWRSDFFRVLSHLKFWSLYSSIGKSNSSTRLLTTGVPMVAKICNICHYVTMTLPLRYHEVHSLIIKSTFTEKLIKIKFFINCGIHSKIQNWFGTCLMEILKIYGVVFWTI